MNAKKKKLIFTCVPTKAFPEGLFLSWVSINLSGDLWFFEMSDIISDRLIYDFDQKKWLNMIDFLIRSTATISS